jgi:5-methylthioadenosine/S-adenosylhomocysteine deaminase
MIIKPRISVVNPDRIIPGLNLNLRVSGIPDSQEFLEIPDSFAYAPLINSHDHLVGNWVPRSGDNRPYKNSHIWVEDMKNSFSVKERNSFWINNSKGDYTEPNAYILARLGAYKNLFSGCGYVSDHGPLQSESYYEGFPITVLRNYHQCHSVILDNWWGGLPPEEEMALTKGKMPFIVHLAEGDDPVSKKEFSLLKERNLLQPNLLLIHGIALTTSELKEIADVGASICWCPASNFYLIGKTLDIMTCLKLGINVTLGTDSTQTGSINLLDEYANAHLKFPEIPLQTLYKMISVNAAKALFLPAESALLNPDATSDLLLIDAVESEPFENLLEVSSENIQLFLHKGIPVYGDAEWLQYLQKMPVDITEFRVGKRGKFVAGNPQELNDRIDEVLGYQKDFPYLPF